MSIFTKSIQVILGILLLSLLGSMAWGEVNPQERLQKAQTYAVSSAPDSRASSYAVGNDAITNLSANSSSKSVTGDGRTGFWIVGILVNITMLGLFLAWAVKEWRKTKND